MGTFFLRIRFIIFVLGALLAATIAHADCRPEQAGEKFITKGSYRVLKTWTETEAKFNEIYESGRRLKERIYQLPDTIYAFQKNGATTQVPATFIEALTRHIELALERGYGDFLFYPDLGHAHLLLPNPSDFKIDEAASYGKLLEQKDLKFLYHTAELMELKESLKGPVKEDPQSQWRYYSRNFVSSLADNENLSVLVELTGIYNTVRGITDHIEKGRVYFSASKNGCLPIQVKGKTLLFDISFE